LHGSFGGDRLLAADRRPARLKDVADAAGVHVSTASRALNEQTAALVNPETLDRVRQAASRLGYRVNGMARALKMRRSLSIGMIVPDITNPFFPPAVRGAEDVLDEAGFSLLLASTDNDQARARRQVTAMLESQVDGMLLAMARREDSLVEELRAGGTPLVLVNRTVERGGVTAVVPDDYHGELQAVEHLYALGHRRIGLLTGPLFTSNAARRLTSFRQAAQRLGLLDGGTAEAEAFDEVAGYRAASVLLAANPCPTAVIAGNDLLAIGVIEAAAQRRLACPRDLSVVGFNDMRLASRVSPPLTTVRVPEYDVGARAAQLLLALINDPGRSPETVLISGELIVRGSTAPPAS
jgi:LacI family transcriptional regulator